MPLTLLGAKRFAAAVAFTLFNRVIGRLPGYALRRAYLRRVLGLSIGTGASVHMDCFVTGRDISIGDRTVLNRRCYLDGRGGLEIGVNVSISPECYLVTLTHNPHDPGFCAVPRRIRIGDYAWLGARAIILPGVQIGKGAVVGAGSVVTRNVEPLAIVAGNPARKIGERSAIPDYSLAYFPYFDSDIQAA